ncbi:hypothetical protein ABPG72_018096 [Tetrahymena utriculariae]
MSPEVFNYLKNNTIPKTDFSKADVYSIGLLAIEAYMKRSLEAIQWLNLKTQNVFKVIPDLKTSKHQDFLNKIVSKMVEPDKDLRFFPNQLLNNLMAFNIDKKSLDHLQYQKSSFKSQKNKFFNNIFSYGIFAFYSNQLKQKQDLQPKLEKIFKKLNMTRQNIQKSFYESANYDYDSLTIDLIDQLVNVDEAKRISNFIKVYHDITQLNLNFSQNEIGVEEIQSITNSIKNFINITHLTLCFSLNEIYTKGCKIIVSALINYQNITHLTLNFGSCQIGPKGVNQIANAIQNYQKIISQLNLSFYNNMIGVEGAYSISDAIVQQINITQLSLDLSYNEITDIGCKCISSTIKNLHLTLKLRLFL